jgi:hypothetical protein
LWEKKAGNCRAIIVALPTSDKRKWRNNYRRYGVNNKKRALRFFAHEHAPQRFFLKAVRFAFLLLTH